MGANVTKRRPFEWQPIHPLQNPNRTWRRATVQLAKSVLAWAPAAPIAANA